MNDMEQAAVARFQRVTSENDSGDDFVSFEFRGRSWRLLRRRKAGVRLPFYYLKAEVGGKVVFQSTGEEKKTKAIEVAKLKIGAALDGRWDALRESRLRETKVVASIGEICAAYTGRKTKEGKVVGGILSSVEAMEMRAQTPGNNVNALRMVVRRALGKEGDVDELPGAVLSRPELVGEFVKAHVAEAGDDLLRRDKRVRGARSTVVQARSVFSEAAMRHCFRGLQLPILEPFLKAPLPKGMLPPKEGLATADVWEMAQSALWLRDADGAARPQARALYMVHLLSRHLGLRNDEIEKARRECLVEQRGEVYLRNGERREIAGVVRVTRRAYWTPKKSQGDVPISPCVWAELMALVEGFGPLDFLVPAETKSDRADLCDRTYNDFVRPWTEHLRKKGYELRRWGQTLVKKREGDEMGSRFVRHAEKRTAGKYYDTETILPAPITLADCGL